MPKIGASLQRILAHDRRGAMLTDYAALGAAMILGLVLAGTAMESVVRDSLGGIGKDLAEAAATPAAARRPASPVSAAGGASSGPTTTPGHAAGPGPIAVPAAPIPAQPAPAPPGAATPAQPRGGEVVAGGPKDAAAPDGACSASGALAEACKGG